MILGQATGKFLIHANQLSLQAIQKANNASKSNQDKKEQQPSQNLQKHLKFSVWVKNFGFKIKSPNSDTQV
jgi:hypothetical protein